MPFYVKRYAIATILSGCGLMPATGQAQLVSDVTGTIDLRLDPFFDTRPQWSEAESAWVEAPNEGQHETYPVTLSNQTVSINGDSYYSTGGLSLIDFQYDSSNAGKSRFDIHAHGVTEGADGGGGGLAALGAQLTLTKAAYYRFEADVLGTPWLYEVSFNGRSADAWYDDFGIYGGTFPLTYQGGNPMPSGWGTYLDQGILQAGVYDLSVAALAGLDHYGNGLGSEGKARLSLYLLGDVNLDGLVGIADLDVVLTHWGQSVLPGDLESGDLNGDGTIGLADLDVILSGWSADVRTNPEPSSATIAFVLGTSLIASRRVTARKPTL